MERHTKRFNPDESPPAVAVADLGDDVLFHIIFQCGLTLEEIKNVCATDRAFRAKCDDFNVWKRMFLDRFKRKGPKDKRSLAELEKENAGALALWDSDQQRFKQLTGYLRCS